jgi:dihydroflavonol-4-reductase
MRIAVLGATGMLGQHAARAALAAGHELCIIHRGRKPLDDFSGLRFTEAKADLDDREALSRALAGADALIHCAAYYPTVPRPWREEVATATGQMANLLAACAEKPLRKIVYLGGAIALRRHPQDLPGDETLDYPGEPENKNPYLQVKWALDRQARAAAAQGLPVVVAIPTMTFGDHDPGSTTGRFVIEIANRTLPGYVRGKRNVIYAGDAGRGLVLACEKGRPGERYLLTGANLTMDELITMIARQSGAPVPRAIPLAAAKLAAALQATRYRWFGGSLPRVDATAIAVMSAGQFLDGSKARRELGFVAEIGTEEAIRRALAWFRTQGYIKQG